VAGSVISAAQGSGTQGLEVVVGTGASVTTEGLGSVIMGGFGTGGAGGAGGMGTPTGNTGAGTGTISGFKSGAVRIGNLGLWVLGLVAWSCMCI